MTQLTTAHLPSHATTLVSIDNAPHSLLCTSGVKSQRRMRVQGWSLRNVPTAYTCSPPASLHITLSLPSPGPASALVESTMRQVSLPPPSPPSAHPPPPPPRPPPIQRRIASKTVKARHWPVRYATTATQRQLRSSYSWGWPTCCRATTRLHKASSLP